MKKYSDQMDVTELMEVKGGKNIFGLCIGKGATAVVHCDAAGSGAIKPQEPEPVKTDSISIKL